MCGEKLFSHVSLRLTVEAHDPLVEALVTEAWKRLERQVLWVDHLKSIIFFRVIIMESYRKRMGNCCLPVKVH
jgi:hypothetical protein